MDLDALAPDAEPELEVMDLDALAPDAEPELEVMDLEALAPDPEPEWDVWDLGALAPDPDPVPMASLAPDAPTSKAPPMDSSEPVRTRTLAELYLRQGFKEQALGVYRYLLEQEPDATDLPERIAELETGGGGPTPSTSSVAEPSDSTPAAPEAPSAGPEVAHSEDEVETLARDLADSGGVGHEVDTPFAWTREDAPARSTKGEPGGIGEYFDSLLSWGSDEG
jgi:hypothetical protein